MFLSIEIARTLNEISNQAQIGFGQAQIGFSQAQIEAWNPQKNIVFIDGNRPNVQKTLFLLIKIA